MASAQVIAMIDSLHGPKLTREDIEWVNDIPAGKGLLDFLASQMQFGGEVALTDIALDKEEANLWARAVAAGLVTLDPPSLTTSQNIELTRTPSDYATPSSLRSLLCGIEEEQRLLDRHLRVLRQRIASTRTLVNQIPQKRKKLVARQTQVSQSVAHLESSLSELSVKADTMLSIAVEGGSKLANSVSVTIGPDPVSKSFDRLTKLLDSFSSIHADLARLSSALFQSDSRDPLSDKNIPFLRSEIQRLVVSTKKLEDQQVAAELEGTCKSLREPASQGHSLCSTKLPSPVDCTEDRAWVDTVAQAWNREQAIDMKRRTENLKEFIQLLQELLPPLVLTCSSLGTLEESTEEVFVAIQALIDELDEVQSDLVSVDIESEQCHLTPASRDDTLELQVKDLLKRLHARKHEGLPSLLLLEREDILSELSDIRGQHETAYNEVNKVCSAASSFTSLLNTSSQNYLSALMAHSPMNTSLPVSLPSGIRQKASETETHIVEASRFLKDIPDDTALDSRTRRRLDGFIRTTLKDV